MGKMHMGQLWFVMQLVVLLFDSRASTKYRTAITIACDVVGYLGLLYLESTTLHTMYLFSKSHE
eukprot:4668349-Amphidinium_carterae.3